jgi:hypothetical protein
MNLSLFSTATLFEATTNFFEQLGIRLNSNTSESLPAKDVLREYYKENLIFNSVTKTYFVGLVDNAVFQTENSSSYTYTEAIKESDKSYEGLMVFALELSKQPTRSELSELTRAFNRISKKMPVAVVFKYGNEIAFATTERKDYVQTWRNGEKIGKITMLKDIVVEKTHAAHLKILSDLKITGQNVDSYNKLHKFWQTKFSVQALNDQFYGDLQDWFYYAIQNIKLPIKPNYIDANENTKNFLVRLLARTLFCWFVKEKGLIKPQLLELTNWEGNKYKLTIDIDEANFLKSNSYYRGVLQNVFFNALNQKDKKTIKDFGWKKYLHPELDIEWFTQIPYLNGGIFDKLDEDNAKESIEDAVINIPNFLFYGIEIDEVVTTGRGARARTEVQSVEHKGLNGILKSYKFTLDENTPFEEDIALDPEMLGLVFENLLAELDPNLDESTIKSIRKLTGSYYTPRKNIFEMVNDSLFLYLVKYITDKYPTLTNIRKQVSDLVYFNILHTDNKLFCKAVVNGLDKFKMLDPACGSGAFPMGMLHRMVDILKIVDPHNELWIELKLNNVDAAQRTEFKKVLSTHLDDYGRKLGIIRDSIYGIDIQPMAVQITKLRFFISLLIDQKTENGITPMPNIETKIICADSLKNIQADMFSYAYIEQLTEARAKYYQPDISHEEREIIANEIIEILDAAFPNFSFQITGKHVSGQNKELLRHWFTHSTLAAPFFNVDFFFPELKEHGGFDCVMGNPPYGGMKISDDVRATLMVESKDPYGAFIARFLSNYDIKTPLKQGGVLAFIVSDTFMTIKSHLPLRKLLMQNYVHKMIRVHPDTFRATVNTVIMIAERNTQREMDDNHICLMADMTNISIHDNYDRFVEILNQTKIVENAPDISTPEYAIYRYPQSLIRTNSNLPFFVASPKLFALMNDGNDPDVNKKPIKEIKEIGGKQVDVRTILMNGKEIEVVKLGDIADVKVGLQTGDNDAYLFQNPNARGTYRSIEEYKEFLLTEEDLEKIRNNEQLRLDVIDKGISIDNPKSSRYFGGRNIIPYDKGGESDSEEGWLPCYNVEVDYYIDWSEWSVSRMKTLTVEEKNLIVGKSGGDTKVCSRFQNAESYFQDYISYSRTGAYAPTFRKGNPTPYDNKSCGIFPDSELTNSMLSYLNSKYNKFSFKCYLGHTVDAQVDDIKELFVSLEIFKIKTSKVIIDKQKSNPRYDYASHEQIEIDKLVYEAYGLNAEDVEEVENWYARRYPRLSAAQKANLRALGKSDDYLELYGMR